MTAEETIKEISCTELKRRLDAGEQPIILDIREPHELEICSLKNTFHIPLGDLRFRLDELDNHKDSEIIIYCRTGRRSLMAAQFMQECGFSQVFNLAGGVYAWSDEIDPSFEKY